MSSRRAEKNDEQSLETRQAQLFMQLYGRWASHDFSRAYGAVRYKNPEGTVDQILQDLLTRNPDLNLPAYADYQMLMAYFEGLGLLVKNGLIDIQFVDDLFSHRIIWYWEMMQPTFNRLRKSLNDPNLYDSIEYLYHEMKHRQRIATRPQINNT
ncbi:MAG: DUF4760 domain-containing protein [Candidatus Hodarchaeales archaeon]